MLSKTRKEKKQRK